jgi:hypothetical protein
MAITVIRDADGDAWLRIGPDRWALVSDVMRGVKYAERYASTREEIEAYGPFTEEWSIET